VAFDHVSERFDFETMIMSAFTGQIVLQVNLLLVVCICM